MKDLRILLKCMGFILVLIFSHILYSQDEFKEWKYSQDEFNEWKAPVDTTSHKNLYWLAGIMGITIMAGLLLRSSKGRKLRYFFLVSSVAILGFYRGACPCPVNGFQEMILFIPGITVHAFPILFFFLLVPITYFMGKVWCGWVCHLGALQELVHMQGKFHLLSSVPAQKIIKYIRVAVLILLVIQLLVTQTVLWKQVDPFKAIFNLYASGYMTWILVAILLASSILIYRPFCKTLCPVGLVLGWVSRIPGAAGIHISSGCKSCKLCSQACRSNAIRKIESSIHIQRDECIACGECMEACKVENGKRNTENGIRNTKYEIQNTTYEKQKKGGKGEGSVISFH